LVWTAILETNLSVSTVAWSIAPPDDPPNVTACFGGIRGRGII
jgi:hypothetical protein